MTIAAWSYLTAAFAFLLLPVLVLIRWRDRPGSLWVAAAGLVSFAWAALLAFASHEAPDAVAVSGGILEVGRNGAWFAVLFSTLVPGTLGARGLSPSLRIWIRTTALFMILMLFLIALPVPFGQGAWPGMAILMMTILGLVLVEQAYRNTPPQRRGGIKFLALGLGALFAFDLFLFADLVLFQALESPTWQARGFVNALVVPLLLVSMGKRRPQGEGPVVSRQLLFHSTALTAAGVYLLAAGGAGYYLRNFGGDVGGLIQVTFLFGAALILIIVLFSSTARAHLRVLLSKHFFKYRYDYREEWLRFTARLSTDNANTPFPERAIYAMADLAGSPGGLLWVRQDDGSFAREGALNLDCTTPSTEDPDSALVNYLRTSGWIIDLNEYRRSRAVYGGLQVAEWMLRDSRLWAIVPLLRENDLEGYVMLTSPLVPHRIDWEERDLLKTAARQLAVYVALIRTNEALSEARQFETLHRLTAFLVHDLKNVSAQLSLLCSNAERHRENPAFVADAFNTVANARDRLERTLEQLRAMRAAPDSGRHESIELGALLGEVIDQSAARRPIPALDIRDAASVTGDREALKNVLLHLVRNAQEATPDDGDIQLALYHQGPWAVMTIEDNGSGIEEEFLQKRLFRPFQTTKGNAGMGIGLYETRDQVARMGGRIDVQSNVGTGTRFTVKLPRSESLQPVSGVAEDEGTQDG